MGKASRKKNKPDPEKLFRDGICLKCAKNPRIEGSAWCQPCAANGSRIRNSRIQRVTKATALQVVKGMEKELEEELYGVEDSSTG